MSANNHKPARLAEAPDPQAFTQYRSVCGLAIVGLLFGLLSPLALIDPAAWLVPLVAVIICWTAILRIRRHDTVMIGRKAAICGLVIAVLSGTTAVSQWFSHRSFVERQAREVATAWFALLADDQPLKAHQLNLIPAERKPLDGDLPGVYKRRLKNREDLDEFLEKPLVRTILGLGKKADIRFYKCEGMWGPFGKENVKEIYLISFDDENGKRKTFFASVLLRRFPPKQPDEINWVVADFKDEIRPLGMPEEEENTRPDDDIDL